MLNPNSTFFVGPWTNATSFAAMQIGELAFIKADAAAAAPIKMTADALSTLDTGGTFAGFQIVQKTEPGPKSDPTWTVPGSMRYSPWLAPAGNTTSKLSPAVEGKIRPGTATFTAYSPITQGVVEVTCPASGTWANLTYVLTVIFKDIRDLSPSVKYQSFYYNAKQSDTNADVAAGLAASINRPRTQLDNIVLITATATSGTITISGIPNTYNMNQRYEYTLVDFEVGLGYANPGTTMNGRIDSCGATYTWTSKPSYGKGSYQIVADMEKRAQARLGITNWVHFPVIMPRMYTVENKQYTTVEFEFNKKYRSADNIVDVQTAESFTLCVDNTTPADASGTPSTPASWLGNMQFAINGR